MKHTPGPWTLGNVGGYGEGGVFSPQFEDGKKPLATVRFPAKYKRGTLSEEAFKETDANARLIAAAPELLEALKLVRHRLWTRRTKFTDDDHAAMNAASSTIAKAEGRD